MDTMGGLIDRLFTVSMKMQVRTSPDLIQQKVQLMAEIDDMLKLMIKAKRAGEKLDDGRFIQRKHKTY